LFEEKKATNYKLSTLISKECIAFFHVPINKQAEANYNKSHQEEKRQRKLRRKNYLPGHCMIHVIYLNAWPNFEASNDSTEPQMTALLIRGQFCHLQ
jgi:hypothetical protein